MTTISVQHLCKRYGKGSLAVDDVSLEINDGEFVVLVGPSGSGKSTVLRMIVGLEDITSGDLCIGGERVNDTPPRDRDLSMVFQNYALYPHLTVYENIAFPLRLHKVAHDDIDKQVRSTASMLQLTQLLDRKPANLSGGQQQRVAMGRALIRKAKAFLFDEPLSNLDAKLRVQMRTEISRLQKQLGMTTVYVTHDQTEAMTLGDRVVLLRLGKLQQVGTPRELYEKPVNMFVAGFLGSPQINFLPADVNTRHLRLPFCDVPFDPAHPPAKLSGKDLVIVGLRPEHLLDATKVDDQHRSHGVTFKAKVDVTEWLGDEQVVYLPYEAPERFHKQLSELQKELDSESDRTQLIVELDATTPIREGEEIELWFDPGNLLFFDPETTENVTLGREIEEPVQAKSA
ncbi:MAG TPA: ABC transporter ATP-binding protein [Gemmatimonadaceae bacterium]|nr:ABC transporter ATP-binding protein [Gemmatimonadaceae bacterium]